MAQEITSKTLPELLASGKPVIVDFWAEWCGPCRMIAPVVEELAAEYEGRIVVGKCNVDDASDLATQYAIRNIPTILFFKNGAVVDKQVGAVGKLDLKKKFEALLA